MWKTKRDFVVDRLRQSIISGELKPGEQLSLEGLSARLSVSFTPIREALLELEADGLVIGERHKGFRVREYTAKDAYQVLTMRAALEPLVAQIALPNITELDIAFFEDAVDRMNVGFEADDAAAVRKANREFHYRLYELTHWPILEKEMDSFWTQSPWSVLRLSPGRTETSIEEHELILDAIKENDSERLGSLLADHVLHARDELVNPDARLEDGELSMDKITQAITTI